MKNAASPELDDRPVVARPAPAFRLPAVVHAEGWAGQDEIVAVAEEHVAAARDEPAVFHRREIDVAAVPRQALPVRRDLAVDPQPGDAAVRINVESQVSHPPRFLLD